MRTERPVLRLALVLPAVLLFPQGQKEINHELVEEQYFGICDHDGDGWISFAEAKVSLKTTRAEYQIYDTDKDGRVTPEEFHERYQAVVDVTGMFPKPAPGAALTRAITRTPTQLRAAYDKDADNALDASELRGVLQDYGREELSADLLLIKLDRDHNSKLEAEELTNLSRLLSGPRLDSQALTGPEAKPKTVDELFGQPVARENTVDATPLPPRIPGPVPPFRRLDLDHDGFISLEDLRGLQSPLQLKARVSAVLATLDHDEDGVISEAEFLASISTHPH